MPNLLEHLSAKQRSELLRDIYYLNLAELHGFCRKHRVPFRIQRERADGRLVATRDNDRKLVVLKRVLRYLETGIEQAPTVFARSVVAETDPPASFRPPLVECGVEHYYSVGLIADAIAPAFACGSVVLPG